MELIRQLDLHIDLKSLARPIVDFAVGARWSELKEFKNFDTWASSRNFVTVLEDYL